MTIETNEDIEAMNKSISDAETKILADIEAKRLADIEAKRFAEEEDKRLADIEAKRFAEEEKERNKPILKYADIENGTNKVLGFLSSDVHDFIPSTCIKISFEEWEEALKDNLNFYDENTKSLSFKDFETDEEKAEFHNNKIFADIQKIELETLRPLREIADINTSGNDLIYAKTKLENLTRQIATLKNEIK